MNAQYHKLTNGNQDVFNPTVKINVYGQKCLFSNCGIWQLVTTKPSAEQLALMHQINCAPVIKSKRFSQYTVEIYS